MDSIWDKIKQQYRTGTGLMRLLMINVGLFVALRLAYVLVRVFQGDPTLLLSQLQLEPVFPDFWFHPWTALSYMFVHFRLMHLITNLLLLYFFGSLLLRAFSERKLLLLYIGGGLAGAVLFLLGSLFIPALNAQAYNAPLIGASASVMAIMVFFTFVKPDTAVSLFVLGQLKLKYITLVVLVLTFAHANPSAYGSDLAHIGGALFGLFLALSEKEVLHWKKWFGPRSRMRVTYNRPFREQADRPTDVDQDYRDRKKNQQETLDAILDKVKRSGYESLSKEEKQKLFDFSKHG